MNDPILVINQIQSILEDALAWNRQGQLAAYAASMTLLRDMREHVADLRSIDVGYAAEKIVTAEWHIGAMFGLDVDNGLPRQQHHVSAIGQLNTLARVLRDAE